MSKGKEIIGEPLVINGRTLSLSRAVRAGDLIYLTGQIPMKDGKPMTEGSIEEQTRSCMEHIRATLHLAGRDLSDIVKTTVWLKERSDRKQGCDGDETERKNTQRQHDLDQREPPPPPKAPPEVGQSG